jgi:hypothetical protein
MALSAETAALRRLIESNRTGALRGQIGGGAGFYDGKRRLCGVYRFLHTKLKRGLFPTLSKRAYFARLGARSKRERETTRRAGALSSSKRMGSVFHAHAHHSLICEGAASVRGRCECPEGKAPKPPRTLADRALLAGMLAAARRALRELGAAPVCGERVIAARAPVSLGTRFDLLAARANRTLLLVSWKTAATCPFASSSSAEIAVDLAARVTEPRRATDTSERVLQRAALAQIACELHMLRDAHQLGASVDDAAIIYLLPGTGTASVRHRIVQLSGASVRGGGYRTAWHWMLERRRAASTASAAKKKASRKHK